MDQERLLTPTVTAVVVALHILLMAVAWHTKPPSLDISTDSLSYVDVGGMPAAGDGGGDANPAPPAQPEPPKPQPKPPAKTEKPQIKGVNKPQQPRPDVRAAPDKPNTTTPQDKPPPPNNNNNEPNTPANHTGNSGGSGSSGSGGGSGSGGAPGGSGQGGAGGGQGNGGPLVPPTHIGSHLGNPKPPYPPLSRENEEEGRVGLRVVVTPEGRAASVTVVKSSGYKRLDNSAKNAVAKYKFRPATRGGVPIQYTYTFSIDFSLSDGR